MSFAGSSFFSNDSASTEIYTLSLHDALPISATINAACALRREKQVGSLEVGKQADVAVFEVADRKSTRLNSSHLGISYAVFCLKKKKSSACSAPSRKRTRRGDAVSGS